MTQTDGRCDSLGPHLTGRFVLSASAASSRLPHTGSGPPMLQWWPLPVPPPRVPVIDERTHEAQLVSAGAVCRPPELAATGPASLPPPPPLPGLPLGWRSRPGTGSLPGQGPRGLHRRAQVGRAAAAARTRCRCCFSGCSSRLLTAPPIPRPSLRFFHRAACSVQAARQCGPPPLLRLLGLAPEQAWEEREACEALCMSACLEQRTPACQQHAAAFCADAFAGPAAGGDLRPIGGGGGKKR